MDAIREYLSRLGKKGGTARAKSLSSLQRTDSARRAAEARWAKTHKLVNVITEAAQALEDTVKKRATTEPFRKK